MPEPPMEFVDLKQIYFVRLSHFEIQYAYSQHSHTIQVSFQIILSWRYHVNTAEMKILALIKYVFVHFNPSIVFKTEAKLLASRIEHPSTSVEGSNHAVTTITPNSMLQEMVYQRCVSQHTDKVHLYDHGRNEKEPSGLYAQVYAICVLSVKDVILGPPSTTTIPSLP